MKWAFSTDLLCTKRPMTKPKRHHYLPQFYLKGFSQDGKLWTYDRKLKKYGLRTPTNVAVKKDYYTFITDEDTKDTEIETVLALYESQAKAVIKKVDNGKNLSIEDIHKIGLFIAFLMVRVPKFENQFNKSYNEGVRHVAGLKLSTPEQVEAMMSQHPEDFRNKPDIPIEKIVKIFRENRYKIEVHRNASLKAMLKLSIKFANVFIQMDWLFLHALQKESYVTSDRPFILGPPPNWKSQGLLQGVDMAIRGARKIVPISQKTCLIMYDRGTQCKIGRASREDVRNINMTIAANCDRFLFARDESLLRNMVQMTQIDQ